MMKILFCTLVFFASITHSIAANAVVKKNAKEICLASAKEQIFKKFKKKADLGNDLNNPWVFVIDEDGCSYVVTVKLDGKVEDCKLSDIKKDPQPSRCEGE